MERLSAWLIWGMLKLASVLSIDGQRRLGRWIGKVAWYLRLEGARVTRVNLDLCFPELDHASRRRLACRSLQHTGMLLMEAGAISHWPEPRWRRLMLEVQGEELLRDAEASGDGALILVPHFGNWEYLALVLGRHRITALYDPPRLRALEPVIHRARTRTGATLLPIDSAGLRRFYRALADGGVTALLPDQVPERNSGVYAPFFGHAALTMTFAHRLLRRTNARALLGTARRCPGGFRVSFLEMDAERLRDPDPAVSATAMNAAIEALVRTDPAQYQWEYRRFKRQPRGTGSPYRRINVARTKA